jgi:hypothetical protein
LPVLAVFKSKNQNSGSSPMLNNAHPIIPIATRVGRSLAASLFFLKKSRTTPITTDADNLWLSATMTAFADVESTQCTEEGPEEDANPLVEAEIYVIFGRRTDAEKVLKSALQAGRINADEVVRFWHEMEAEQKSAAKF